MCRVHHLDRKKRVKLNDADNRLSHRQKLTLLAGTLAHKVVIVSKNSDIFIEIKVLSFFLFQFEKKNSLNHFEFFPSSLSWTSHDV